MRISSNWLAKHIVIHYGFLIKYCYSRKADENNQNKLYLGPSERKSFVKTILKLIDRGQYSKNEYLADTVAAATSILSYVEPSLVLPFVAYRFVMALETVSHIASS